MKLWPWHTNRKDAIAANKRADAALIDAQKAVVSAHKIEAEAKKIGNENHFAQHWAWALWGVRSGGGK